MKILKLMALSDLHLGEPEGVLFNSEDSFNLIDITINKIIELSRGDKDFNSGIEQLILIGDIIELSEATDEEAYINTKFFLTTLLKKVEIDKIIYVPGNHDHHLWVELLKKERGKDNYRDCIPKTQVNSSILNKEIFIKNCLPSTYLSERVDIRYPNYRFETDNAYYFFDHGHLFSKVLDVSNMFKFTDAENVKSLEDLEEQIYTFAVENVKSLEDLEERTYIFMEKIWYETKSRTRETVFEWFRKLNLEIFHSARGTTFREDCNSLLDNYIRKKIKWYLVKICGIKDEVEKDFHFIFGHSHHGGRSLKADRKVRINGKFISLWNTGGWIVPSKVFSPEAYIFYAKQTQSGLKPDMYKLVSQEKPEDEGDYPKEILHERSKHIG